MTDSIIVAIVIAVAVFYWLIRSRIKEAHHLDGLHLAPDGGKKSEQAWW